jgi:hypothetical protein
MERSIQPNWCGCRDRSKPERDYTRSLSHGTIFDMKHQIPVILAGVAVIAGVAAALLRGHFWAAVVLYVVCSVLFVVALVAGYRESLPEPNVVIVGFGRAPALGSGLIIQNDAEPAYNIAPPKTVQVGGLKIIFEDPVITRLTKDDGQRWFPVSIETSLGKTSLSNLASDMILRDVRELDVEFSYADGRNPGWARYTTVGKIKIVKRGTVEAIFEKKKFQWFPW